MGHQQQQQVYTVDGFTGTAEALVANLHKGSRAPAKDDATWMRETAHRIRNYSGAIVRRDSPDHFVQDLILLDLLHLVKG